MNVLSYKGYQGHFEYDEEADLFHGDVLNLADVVTFEGRSIDELREALADSVDDYLEFCESRGRQPQKPYSGRFNVRIAPEVHQMISLEAARAGVSLNSWVSETLARAVHECRSA